MQMCGHKTRSIMAIYSTNFNVHKPQYAVARAYAERWRRSCGWRSASTDIIRTYTFFS
jgi:hypothetical protein